MSAYIIHDNGNDRPATADEIKDIEARHREADKLAEQQQQRETARTSALAKLAALGLTDDEIAGLLP